jgi:hypothetical protein
MWNTLETTYEGTTNVKQSKINALTQEFELFHIKHSEIIPDMQK